MTAIPAAAVGHAVLISEAQKWLWRQGCSIVITDMAHGGRETPDAIGWRGRFSTLIECKASRADFLADGKKPFRRMPETGMGVERWFCTLRGVIKTDELPAGWGLMEFHGGKMWILQKPEPQRPEEGAREEIQLLLSAIRRIGATAPTGINVKFYTQEFYASGTTPAPKSRATLGVCLDHPDHSSTTP